MTTATTHEATTHEPIDRDSVADSLPRALRVLAVTARPGQESAELGGLLYAFRRGGAALSLLCLTRGEAAPHNSGIARLEAVRPWEVQMAASVLGISDVAVGNFRDGALHHYSASQLAERIHRAIRQYSPDLVLILAPEVGGTAEIAVARAATAAAARAGLPVAARTRRGVPGAWTIDLGTGTELARAVQRSAAAAHTSQSDALPALIATLDELGHDEWLRWVLFPRRVPAPRSGDLMITA